MPSKATCTPDMRASLCPHRLVLDSTIPLQDGQTVSHIDIKYICD